MSSLAVGHMNHVPSTVDTSLSFRGSANEMAIKGGAIRNRTPGYKLVQLVADHSFRIQANVCDPTKMIVKHSLQTLICFVLLHDSEKGSQQVGFSITKFMRSF